jgi:hypothetical protein
LWTKPWRTGYYCGFNSKKSFRVAADLSLRLARLQFETVELVTDSRGRDWISRFGLPFDSVRTDLDRLEGIDPRLWCYGKVETYRIQDEPFFHLDFDVFLKLPLPLAERFVGKAVVFQGWEYAPRFAGQYARAVRACKVLGCSTFPPWKNGGRAAVAGVVAGLDLDDVRRWCAAAQDWVESRSNARFWKRALEGDSFKFCVAMEQYLPVELFGEDRVGVLLESPYSASELGFVHYAGDLKRLRVIERRIWDHWKRPRAYERPVEPVRGFSFGDLNA